VQVNIRDKHQQRRPAAGGGVYRAVHKADAATGIMESHFQLMQSFLTTQESVMRAFLGSGGDNVATPMAMAEQPAYAIETIEPAQVATIEVELMPAPVEVNLAPAPNGKAAAAPQTLPPAPVNVVEVAPAPAAALVPVAAAPVVSPAAAAVAKSTTAVDMKDALLQVVSDRTGYPVEMLGLDLDMEADLGIDSIKRIEILSALQQLGGNQDAANESMMEEVAKLKTLRQILDFFRTRG